MNHFNSRLFFPPYMIPISAFSDLIPIPWFSLFEFNSRLFTFVTSSIVARHIFPSFILYRSPLTSQRGRGKFPFPTGSPFHKVRNAKPLKGCNASTGRQFAEEQRSLHSVNQADLSTSGCSHGRATGTTRDIFS